MKCKVLCVVAVVMMFGGIAEGRLDPLRGLSEMSIRSDVMIILDTSGSMNIRVANPSNDITSGTDC